MVTTGVSRAGRNDSENEQKIEKTRKRVQYLLCPDWEALGAPMH